MKTKRTLLAAGGLSVIVLSAPLAKAVDLRPLVVTNLGGTLHVLQSVPCDGVVDLTTRVRGGRIEMTPAEGPDVVGGDKIFHLTGLTLFFMPFRVDGKCRGVRDPHNVTEIGVRLAGAVVLRAVAGDNRYHVTIPKEEFLLYDAIIDNDVPKTAYERPSEAVTGTIDLARGTMQLHIVVATRLRFRAGCNPLFRCRVDEVRDGTRTVDVAGTIIFPDRAAASRPEATTAR